MLSLLSLPAFLHDPPPKWYFVENVMQLKQTRTFDMELRVADPHNKIFILTRNQNQGLSGKI